MKSFKILFVTNPYPPAVLSGGPLESVSGLARALVARGHKVTVAANRLEAGKVLPVSEGVPYELEGVKVLYFNGVGFPGMLWGAASLGVKFRKWLIKNLYEIDAVDLQLGFHLDAPMVARSCQQAHVPFIYHQRGNLDPLRFGKRGGLKRSYIWLREKKVLQGATALVALSHREEEVYKLWAPGQPVFRIPNGINPSYWSMSQGDENIDIPGWPPRDDGPVMLWMARMDPRKGPFFALQVMAEVIRQFPKARGILAGPGSEEIRSALKKNLSELGLGAQVKILSALHGRQRVIALHRTDYFLLPTEGEGMPMGVLESLAAGTPVLISREANIPEVKSKDAGWIIEKKPELWAKIICDSWRDPNKKKKLNQSAHQLATTCFGWPDVAEKYEKMMKEILSYGQR